jgi:hypothetical protein
MTIDNDQLLNLTPKRALNIIGRLREGVPPLEDVSLFTIGREELVDYFDKKLREIAMYEIQGIKFIQADYGHGKTHFLDILAQLALDQNFVVSIVSLDRETAPFNKLERVIPLIMDKIMVPTATRGGLGRILQAWSEKVRGWDTNKILRTINDSENLQLLFPDFQLKLVEYARDYNSPDGPAYQACLNIEKWFRGEETKSKTFKNIPGFLAAFVQFVKHLGYSGFVVMLDEAESITLLSRITNRDQANENLRQIIDNQDLQGFYFVFASTPSFLSGEDDRGAQTYPALWRRISDPLGQLTRQQALEKIIIELPSLNEAQFGELACRIKQIFQASPEGEVSQVTSEHLHMLGRYVIDRTDKSVRTLVRSTVMLLDEAKRDGQLDVLSNYELIVEKVLQDEERKRAL